MKRNIVILALVAVAVIAVWFWDSSDKGKQDQAAESYAGGKLAEDIPAKPAPKPNHYAPSVSLASLDGTTSYDIGGKRDKVLIINFWAAWCGPCEEEAPDLKDIFETHKDKLDLYAVNATKYDKLREAKDFVKEQQIVFPVMTDPKGEALDLYKVTGYPVSFIVDRNGVIRHRIEGIIDREQWELYLQDVINS
ncbi:TlpA family protein disulfide reductase [Cohnella cholangitidis]|uniref:TlpA family protein disulfide reductase n=1 Tax=Cohnella cholangitidis TaxID=2598458 RepID=A0A7G5C3U7_9BACL|nr:TlpA disulfide reductase family protein [Cohnella cholangitidis]QMV43881.1 TlpA family protein disulfide reductase [Cohnella cholangitidis]